MNLQTHYDLKIARQNLDAKDIKRIKAERAVLRPLERSVANFVETGLVIDGSRDANPPDPY
jgi:hypothetical protein